MRNAFEKYLLTLPRADAVEHVIDCLRDGSTDDNAAWALMEKYNGEWQCPPIALPHLVLMTLVKLEQEKTK